MKNKHSIITTKLFPIVFLVGMMSIISTHESFGKSFTNDGSRQTYVPARDNTFENGDPTKSFCIQEHHWHDDQKPGYDKGGLGSEPNDRFHDIWGPGILPCPIN